MKGILLIFITAGTFFASAQKNSASRILHVKFEDQLVISAESGKLLMENKAYPQSGVLEQYGYWKPFYSIDPQLLAQYYEKAKQRLKKNLSDPKTIFEFRVNEGMDLETVKKELERLPNIRYVSIPPKLCAPATPDFQPTQLYLFDQAPGIHAEEFWNTYNNHGAGIKICDIEYSFNPDHLDLPQVTILGPPILEDSLLESHGTAVLGEIASLNNGFGTTGISYESELYFSEVFYDDDHQVAGALMTALQTLEEGDIVLIEQHIWVSFGNGPSTFVPVEWYEPYYDAIQLVSGNGIIVVEPAGNGYKNLDHPDLSTGNNGHYPFLQENWSEAIMVGAGSIGTFNPPRSWLPFSNYGARVDLQGIGEGVVTTGGGSLYAAEGENHYYTNSFGGTSSASPIVAGAIALLQSLHEQHTGARLSANVIRDLLVSTGKPQTMIDSVPIMQKIGPLPNVFAAANLMMDHLGIEAFQKDGFSIYPNPNQGSFEVYVPNAFVSELRLRDLTGKEIPLNDKKTPMGFDVSSMNPAPGMYYLSVVYADGMIATKSIRITN